jgi:hypothetical protein
MCLVILSFAQSEDEQIIRSQMDQQIVSWNKADLEGFMESYWKNDSLLFIGKQGVTLGWKKTLENYKKGYPDTAALGHLFFDILLVKRLSPEYFYVVGKWHLSRTIGNLEGHYTLLFKKINGKWVIIADHSS